MVTLRVEGLTKRFGQVLAVDSLSFEAKSGDLVTLLGPSGCGKSSTLMCIAGLERPDSGDIYIEEKLLSSVGKGIHVPPEKRDMGMVFQNYALWPHRSVGENIAYPLRIRNLPKQEIFDRVKDVLRLVGLEGLEHRFVWEISGGQQQRVALARALVYNPKVLLLDEPLSNLDARLREKTRIWLKELKLKLKITTIYVTHDQIEAFALSDVIIIMNNGRIQQVGTPVEIYQEPANLFVSDFIGGSNILGGTVVQTPRTGNIQGYVRIEIDGQYERFRCPMPSNLQPDEKVFVTFKADEVVFLGQNREEELNVLQGSVSKKVYLGKTNEYVVHIGESEIKVESKQDIALGTKSYIFIPPESCFVIKR